MICKYDGDCFYNKACQCAIDAGLIPPEGVSGEREYPLARFIRTIQKIVNA